jgi:hypothetical protein
VEQSTQVIELHDVEVREVEHPRKGVGGRPKGRDISKGKYHRIGVAVDEQTYNKIVDAAAKTKQPLSVYCRNRIVAQPEVSNVELVKSLTNELSGLRSDIRKLLKRFDNTKLANNVNQIAHQMNILAMIYNESHSGTATDYTRSDGTHGIKFTGVDASKDTPEIVEWNTDMIDSYGSDLTKLRQIILQTVVIVNGFVKEKASVIDTAVGMK